MATITSLGAGSGLDLESLVTKLMSVEKAPLNALTKKESAVNTKISAFGTLSSKLSALQTAAQALKANIGQTALQKFATYSTTVADTSIASATAGTGAVAGTYTLNVTKLAVSDQFVSNTVTSTSDPIGTAGDTLTFAFATPDANGNSRSKTITLDSSNNSLTGLRNSINGANMGITATIITGSAGAQLVLTGEQGLDNKITLGGNLASQLTQTATADSAAFTVNGIAATSNTNAASKVIDGVTLNLTKTGSTTLTVAAEYSSNLSTALNSFIKAYNDANSTMATMGAYNATTKVAGALQGNSLLQDARQQTRSLVFGTTVGGTSAYQRLSDIGVSVGTDGSLSLDTTKLNKALASDTVSVATLVDKVGSAFNTTLEQVVGTTGKIKIATDSANSMIKELQKREDAVQLHLDQIEARYRKRFTAMDTLVAKLNSTSTYLTTQLANLTSSTSSK
uniref:Flagellar hook-associated protein 2 n=1 Tax=Dechloromonas aromatica (strain RCB) TaxID=159087 RepID=Q47HZ3_DECAR